MNDESTEALNSLHSSASDILRWIMLIALRGSASGDRKRDIISAARRIIDLVEKL